MERRTTATAKEPTRPRVCVRGRPRVRWLVGLAGWVILLGPSLDGQAARTGPIVESPATQSRGQPTYKGGVDMVALDVCVTTRDGGFVSALEPDDFLILEDREPQMLELFLPDGRLPLSVVLLVDRSTSMSGAKLEQAKQAATAFLDQLDPNDRVEILAFNELADRRLPLSTLRDARAAAARAIAGVRAQGRTGLYEALLAGLRDLQQSQEEQTEERRSVLLVLSDGEDTSSRPSFDHVLEEVRRSGVLVYGISLHADPHERRLPPSRQLVQLAHDSGGRAVAVQDINRLTEVYKEIAVELRHLYRIGYIPADQVGDGGWRHIAIQLEDKDLRARTRAGYYAARRRPRR